MANNARHFGKFRGQTKLKHFVLESYLETWANVQLQHGDFQNAWFIDAFAGKGKDDGGNAGSPLIACRVSRRVSGHLATRLPPPLPVLNVVAIEEHAKRFRALTQATEEFTNEVGGNCLRLMRGTLDEHVSDVMALGDPSEPKLFFLDPFGVRGLNADVVKQIFTRQRYEALILFSDSGAIRLDGAARAESRRSRMALVASPSLFDIPTEEGEEETAREIEPDEPLTAPATEEILRTAFGDEFTSARITAEHSPHPRIAWMRAYLRALHKWGATHVLPFSVVDETDAHRYYLIHAATHGMAIAKMKDSIRAAMNKRSADPNSQTSMLYASAVSTEEIMAVLRARFGGTSVRWYDKNNPNTIREYLVRETDALHSDMKGIQAALNAKGWRLPSRAAQYLIPVKP